MGGLDRNTIILWLVTALIAATGGSIGTQFVEPPDRFYGQEGRALQTEVSRLKAMQKEHVAKIVDLQKQQGIIMYRQSDCIGELQKNEDEHKDLAKLLHRLERLEWDVERINRAILKNKVPEAGFMYPSPPPDWGVPQAAGNDTESTNYRLSREIKAAMIEGGFTTAAP